MEYNREALEEMIAKEMMPQNWMNQGDSLVNPLISGSEDRFLEAIVPGPAFKDPLSNPSDVELFPQYQIPV